jgi:single-stranded DNA-binding protein
MSLNRAMIIGNLGQDPEIRYPPSGVNNHPKVPRFII